jgi:hypothetical protein
VADDSSLDKILDRLPYSDGTGRRRFVSGGILLTGIIVVFLGDFKIYLVGLEAKSLVGSPIILLAAVLILYALGNLTEMLGGLFLVRMASGVMWTLGFPHRASRKVSNRYARWLAYGGLIVWAPFYMLWEMVRGLRGDTRFRLPLESDLTPGALKLIDSLPSKVRSGLYHPVSNDAEFSTKYMVDSFATETNRRWARRLLGQADDVLSITTAFILIALMITTTELWRPAVQVPAYYKLTMEDVKYIQSLSINGSKAFKNFNESFSHLVEGQSTEECSDIASTLDKFDLMTGDGGLLALRSESDKARLMGGVVGCFEGLLSDYLEVARPDIELARRDIMVEFRRVVGDVEDLGQIASDWEFELRRTEELFRDRLRVAEELKTIASWVKSLIVLVIFLFLYVGYFKTLRIALVNIVEASIVSGIPPGGVDPER